MSYTEIYKFDKAGNASQLGEVKNAFRGAMAIWHIIEKKYLPNFVPEYFKNLPPHLALDYSRTSDQEAIKEIWSLFDGDAISQTDKIVLGSSFDKVIVMKENLQELIQAFKDFEGNTSLKEQAEIIEHALEKDEDLIAIGWNQTSVNGGAWENENGDEDEEENVLPYNMLTSNSHWNLFDDLNKKEDDVK